MTTTDKETFSSFMNKVLAGTAIAIVVALIPNAILATFLKPLLPNMAAAEFLHIVQVFQFFTPIMAGFLIGQQFKFNPMQQLAVGGAAYILSLIHI
ncbi:PTS sugar transporter subunit IIC, partial [Streptococcus pyogenes]|uniref:PTS sugar transporter subunit IIC n=1 Tax=Streptococcus pyogenes TaxID=1314 RepID=UPI001135FDE6